MTWEPPEPPPRRNPADSWTLPENLSEETLKDFDSFLDGKLSEQRKKLSGIQPQLGERVGLSQKDEMIWQALIALLHNNFLYPKEEVICEAKRWVNAFLEETGNVEIK